MAAGHKEKSNLLIWVIPNASKTELIEKLEASSCPGFAHYPPEAEVLKIKIASMPEDGAANAELIKFLAQHFSIPRTSINIRSGLKSRFKVISLT